MNIFRALAATRVIFELKPFGVSIIGANGSQPWVGRSTAQMSGNPTEYWLFCSCSDRPKHQTLVRNSKSTFVCSVPTKLDKSWTCRKFFLRRIVTLSLINISWKTAEKKGYLPYRAVNSSSRYLKCICLFTFFKTPSKWPQTKWYTRRDTIF